MADGAFPASLATSADAVLSPDIGGREIPGAVTFTVTNLLEVAK